jgi:hypothetical protein
MPVRSRTVCTSVELACVLSALVASGACSRKESTSTPVATPTVAVRRAQAPAGRAIDVTYRFAVSPSAPPFAENYTVFVHALDKNGDRLWTGDHQPPTPTSQWKPGTVVEYTQPMVVPRLARPERVTIAVGIYSPTSKDRLTLSGDDIGRRAYRVGTIEVTAPPGASNPIYLGGWHDLEAPEGPQGTQWRWSKDKGTVWLLRPTGKAELVLALDQPTEAFGAPQQVTILNGETVLDAFPLPRGRLELRRVPLPPPSEAGDHIRLELTVAVDRTFVPARIAALQSRDTRELGVRVFDIHVEEE